MTVCVLKPGIDLIEPNPVPIRYTTDIGRLDIIGDRLIVTLYDLQPGENARSEAIVVDKIGFPIRNVVDAVQFVLSAMAEGGLQIMATEPVVLHS